MAPAVMSWSDPIDLYCERADPSFWAEPANALTNVAFLFAAAAAYMRWRRSGARDPATLALILVTGLVGLGSFIFHTIATRGAALADVIPIALFIYGYLFLALRRFLQFSLASIFFVLIVFALASRALSYLLPPPALNGSGDYLPPLVALIAIGASARAEALRRGMLSAAATFAVALVFRTIDRSVCAAVPLGSHFIWHLMNAAVLYLLLRTAIDAETTTAKCDPSHFR